jgi:hypothetical protein
LTGLKKYEKWVRLNWAIYCLVRRHPYFESAPLPWGFTLHKTIISLILRDAAWPINQPPLVKTCSKELGKDEK